jgi:microcystin-dependent protein
VASGQTPRRKLPFMKPTDAPKISADIESLAVALDNDVAFTSGVAASIPPAGLFGRKYYATDNGFYYLDNGTEWIAQEWPGRIVLSATPASIPGWLTCEGQAVATSTYANLFLEIGYIYGGSGTTFKVPDFRGRTPIGNGTSGAPGISPRSVGQQLGEETHTLTIPEIPAHVHEESVAISESGGHEGGGSLVRDNSILYNTRNISKTSTGGGGSHNNMQPSLVSYFWIKT